MNVLADGIKTASSFDQDAVSRRSRASATRAAGQHLKSAPSTTRQRASFSVPPAGSEPAVQDPVDIQRIEADKVTPTPEEILADRKPN